MANNMPSFLQGLSQLKKSASALQNNIRNRGDHNSSHHQYQRLQQNDNNFSNAKQYEYDARRASDRLDTGHEKHITNAKQKQRRRTENGSQNVLRDNSTRLENVVAARTSKYPTANPLLKHDLLCFSSIIDIINGKPTNNNATIPLENIDDLTYAIEQSAIPLSELPRDIVKLSTIYTYPDAPTEPKPLSTAPRVWRLARQDLFDRATTNNTNSILDVCTIAVKLPVHISQKDINAQNNTKKFRNFVQYLHTNELVALLACDSAGRVGFIVTSSSTTGTEGRYSALLYYAQAKKFLPLARQNYNNNNNGIAAPNDAPSDGEIICQEPSQHEDEVPFGGKLSASWRGGNIQLLRPFTPLSSISNNREPRGSKNGSSGVPFTRTPFGGRGSRRGYTALASDEQGRGYNGQSGRGSSRGIGDSGPVKQNSTGRAFGNVLTNQPRPSHSNNATKPPPSLARSSVGSSILRGLKEKKKKLNVVRNVYEKSLVVEGSIVDAVVDATRFTKQIYNISEEEAVLDVIEILCEHLYIDLFEFEVDKIKKDIAKLVTPAILSTNEPTVESMEEEMKLEYAIRSISLETDVSSSQHVRSDFVSSTLTNTIRNVLPKKGKNKKAKAKKKSRTDLVIDKEANIPAFIQHIDEARSSFNSQDYSGALFNYNKALSLEVPDETVTTEILSEAIQCLSVCKQSDLEGLKTASQCTFRCMYYLRRHRGCGVDVTDHLISCHHHCCRVLCQLLNCEGVSHEDALLYCNFVNKSIGFISSVNIERVTVSIKDDCQLYKTIAQTKLDELKNEFKYQHPEDVPVLKTMDACGGNEDIIDVCRDIFHSDSETLSDIESILRQQMELGNEAKAEELPQKEYEQRYDDLRVKLVNLIEKLTGRTANLGYGLGVFLVLYWMNYCPPSLKDYICQLFKANKIDPTSCCPSFMLTSLVTVLTREAGGTDDDTPNTVLNDSAFVDLLCWVCDSNESSEYVKEIPIVEAALQSTKLPELVQSAISLTNITLIVTYNNVYHNIQPTIVALGANSRDKGCNKKKMDEIRTNREATFATTALHPQMAMDDRYCQNVDEETLANSSKVGVLVNSVHGYTVTVPLLSLAYQKFAGTAGMSKEELAAKALSRYKIRQKGGRNCMENYGKNDDDQYNRAVLIGEMGGRAMMEKFGKNEKNQYKQAVSMGEMNTEKQKAARKIHLAKGAFANSEKQKASRKINLAKGRIASRDSLLDVDFSETGVRFVRKSIRWHVLIRYQGKEHYFGSFPTQEKATIGNEAARRSLESTRNDELTPDQISTNVILARDAAHLVVYGTPDTFAGVDFTKKGLSETPYGRWKLVISYQLSQRHIGIYATREEAAAANEAARRSLELTRNNLLTTEEIHANINKAKKVAQEAADEIYVSDSD